MGRTGAVESVAIGSDRKICGAWRSGSLNATVSPFLLGLILLTASLWRAQVTGWQPFAVLVADIAFGMVVNGSHTPADWIWWIDPIVTIAAFAWLGVGVIRYRAADEPPAKVADETHRAELAVA